MPSQRDVGAPGATFDGGTCRAFLRERGVGATRSSIQALASCGLLPTNGKGEGHALRRTTR